MLLNGVYRNHIVIWVGGFLWLIVIMENLVILIFGWGWNVCRPVLCWWDEFKVGCLSDMDGNSVLCVENSLVICLIVLTWGITDIILSWDWYMCMEIGWLASLCLFGQVGWIPFYNRNRMDGLSISVAGSCLCRLYVYNIAKNSWGFFFVYYKILVGDAAVFCDYNLV